MINTFFYMAIPSTKTKYAYTPGLGDIVTRVNMPHVFKINDPIMFDGVLHRVLNIYYDASDDCFVATIYKRD